MTNIKRQKIISSTQVRGYNTIVQTCYVKWLSICSGYCEYNAVVYVCRVELSVFFIFIFFSFSFVVFLLVPVLFACATILYDE